MKEAPTKDVEESPEEEAAETPEQEQAEDEGSELHSSTDEVPVSEEYQAAAHKLVGKANKHHLSHLRSLYPQCIAHSQ